MPERLDRPGQPLTPDSAEGTPRPDPPQRWSRAELSRRLDNLPACHPSAPPPGTAEAQSRNLQQADRRPDRAAGTFWARLADFERAWAAHEKRWPARETTTPDRSGDPPGSWRSDGGHYLSPDDNQRANEIIGWVHEKETALTRQMTEVEAENGAGGHLEGLEFARKGEDRIKEKVADVLVQAPRRAVADAIRALPDVLRYTFCFDSANYAAGYNEVRGQLEARGNRMVLSRNNWGSSPEYKGINTRWDTPDGQRFEVQMHTLESFTAKHKVTHLAYKRLRNPATTSNEERELHAYQRAVTDCIPDPDGAAAIPDFPRKGHA